MIMLYVVMSSLTIAHLIIDSGEFGTGSGSNEERENIQNITDKLQKEKYVIVDFNVKPFLGLVKEIVLPIILIV